MSDKKTINISADLFNLKKKNQTMKNEKIKAKPVIKPNTLKRQLLNKIKEHRQNEKTKEERFMIASGQSKEKIDKPTLEQQTGNFQTDFSNALNYFQSIKEKQISKNQRKKNNKTMKNLGSQIVAEEQLVLNNTQANTRITNENNQSNHNIAINKPVEIQLNLPDELINTNAPIAQNDTPSLKLNPPPPYSNLKNTNRPTYRQWKNQTQKNTIQISETNEKIPNKTSLIKQHVPSQNIPSQNETPIKITNPVENSIVSERQTKLNQLKNMFSKKNEHKQNNHDINSKIYKKFQGGNISKNKTTTKRHTKTLKRKYVCGKLKEGNIIKVLIKDNQTRKKINREITTLKKQNINDIKKYLRDHGFIKVGSTAPNDVLRIMYESCILTGDIKNENGDILVHNYLNTNKNDNNK